MNPRNFGKNPPGKLVPIPEGGLAFVPAPLPPALNLSAEVSGLNESALLGLGELRAIVPVLPNPKLLTNPFLRREAVLSSRIEGTRTRLEQLYLFEVEEPDQGIVAPTDQEADAREVLNYVAALEYGLSQLGRLPICERLLKELHARLMEGVRGQDQTPGRYRTVQNFIGRSGNIRDARFVPPPVAEMRQAIRDLERYVNQPTDSYPTLVRIALVHYQFETIHPFSDGNGRLGRLLVSLMLAERGILQEPLLYLSAYFERHREDYMDRLLRTSLQGDWDGWLRFFLTGVRDEALDAARRSRRLLTLREELRRQFQRRASAHLLSLLDHLFDSPVTTTLAAQKQLGLSYNGAKQIVQRLVSVGILEQVPTKGRSRLFLARPILQILDEDVAA